MTFIRSGFSIPVPTSFDKSAVNSAVEENSSNSKPFTRAAADGMMRMNPGALRGSRFMAPQHLSAGQLQALNYNMADLFRLYTAPHGSQTYEIPFVLENGDIAMMTGNATRQTVRCETGGRVVEFHTGGPWGPEIVSGFNTSSEIPAFLQRMMTADSWENARLVPPG